MYVCVCVCVFVCVHTRVCVHAKCACVFVHLRSPAPFDSSVGRAEDCRGWSQAPLGRWHEGGFLIPLAEPHLTHTIAPDTDEIGSKVERMTKCNQCIAYLAAKG